MRDECDHQLMVSAVSMLEDKSTRAYSLEFRNLRSRDRELTLEIRRASKKKKRYSLRQSLQSPERDGMFFFGE